MTLTEILALPPVWIVMLIAGTAGIALGVLLEWLFARAQHARLDARIRELEVQIRDQETLREERAQLLELVQSQLSGTFGDLANKTLKSQSETFLRLAEQNLGAQQQKASSELQAREKAVETLVKPIHEALRKTEEQIQALEKSRREAYGGISKQLEFMQQSATALQTETRNLVTALRRPEVRGQWGEITLRRLAEMAGMVEHCDFVEQENRSTDDGRVRPDMIIRMPDDRELVVDVKTPLDAYLSAVEATDDNVRREALKRHARKVRDRIRELSMKAYWSQFDKSPEFVILFIPGDQFLTAALNEIPDLIDEALRQKIILATPTSFVALLKAVAYGWRQLSLAENAEQIRKLAVDLHDRLATYGTHMNAIGSNLRRSVDAYNKAVGSLERSVLPGARKFIELGVQSKKNLQPLEPVDASTREMEVPDPASLTDKASGDT